MRFLKILWQVALSASVFVGSITLSCAQAATNSVTKTEATKPNLRHIERQKYDQTRAGWLCLSGGI